MTWKNNAVFGLALLVLLGLVEAAQGGVIYQLTDLGTLPNAISSEANAINLSGRIVGDGAPGGSSGAFFYCSEMIVPIPAGYATAINNAGVIVGIQTINGIERAYVYDAGQFMLLGTLGGPHSRAYGINDAGQIAGGAHLSSGFEHAALFYQGTVQDLGTLIGPDAPSVASGINSNGQIVGTSSSANGNRAFLYSSGAMLDLGALGGNDSNGYAINDAVVIVGWARTSQATGNQMHAFLYDGKLMHDLGTLGGDLSVAYGINQEGQIVGQSNFTVGGTDYHAFIYQGGALTDLNSLIDPQLGFTLHDAKGINDAGQIVGSGITADGQTHAFLLTPSSIPEPSSFLLSLTGAALFGWNWLWRRRR